LHEKIYGRYNEFKEETIGIPERMGLIEKLYAEIDEVKSSREEAVSKVAELEQFREEAVFQGGIGPAAAQGYRPEYSPVRWTKGCLALRHEIYHEPHKKHEFLLW
jgi:hypothetical protein